MYDRQAVLLPYIEQYLLDQGINIVTRVKKIPLQVGMFNIVRLWGVFLAKCLVDIKNGFGRENAAVNNNKNLEESQVFLVRTVGQAHNYFAVFKSY